MAAAEADHTSCSSRELSPINLASHWALLYGVNLKVFCQRQSSMARPLRQHAASAGSGVLSVLQGCSDVSYHVVVWGLLCFCHAGHSASGGVCARRLRPHCCLVAHQDEC